MGSTIESTSAQGAEPRTDEPPPEVGAEIEQAERDLDGAAAVEVIAWAVERYGADLALASSFQDCVLVDLAVRVDPRVRVVFLDTGYHFPETLAYLRRVQRRYDLVLDVRHQAVPLDVSPCGAPGCCQARKVEPLAAALAGSRAWITGLKRVDTPERTDAPLVGWDAAKMIVKVNPIAAWTEQDVERYIVEHDLPRHPLTSVGYTSIGCAPTTRPVADGEDPRAGRWPDSDKTECGLHI